MSPWELPLSTKPDYNHMVSHLEFYVGARHQRQFLMLARKTLYCLGHLLCSPWIWDLKENLLPGNSGYTPDVFCLRFLLLSLLFSYSWFTFNCCSNFYKTLVSLGRSSGRGREGWVREYGRRLLKWRYVSGILWKPNNVETS